jgi:IclR family pca regulon transcriptional regulator
VTGRPPHFVESLARGLAVITAFDADHRVLTLAEVARRTDLSRATARRSLLTLADLGYVRTDGPGFALTPQVLRLGAAYLGSLGLPDLALPHLERLSATVDESSSCAVLDGDDIVYVARVPRRRIMTVAISVGTRFPAYATSMGRVMLAHLSPEQLDGYLARTDRPRLTERTLTEAADLRAELDRVRGQGYACVDQELEPGLRSAAAPVTDASGSVRAAVNVSMPGSSSGLDAVVPALLVAARAVSADLAAARLLV